jgi:hypothetical protein
MPTHNTPRYIYKGELAQALRTGQNPEDKLPLLYTDLGVTNDAEAVLALAVRHISGFQRVGRKTRRYPSGPLRWHLRSNQEPEDKLPDLYSYLAVSNHREALLALAERHVPGFRRANPLRSGGRSGTSAKRRNLRTYEAHGDEDSMCERIDDLRRVEGVTIEEAADYLSRSRPKHGQCNPGYGLSKEYIIDRYTHRERYDRNFDKKRERLFLWLRKMLGINWPPKPI